MTDRAAASARLTYVTLALAATLGATGARAQQGAVTADKPPTAAERVLFRLENEWAQGVVKRDPAAVRRLTSTRWVYTDETGTMNREQGVAAFTTGADTVTSAVNEQMHATLYGNTAIVTGVLVLRGHESGKSFEHRYRYTDSWMKLGGRWLCIASQDYLMPEATR